MIRVYSVRPDSIGYEFYNCLKLELTSWKKYGENHCFFDQDRQELHVFDKPKHIHTIKLNPNGSEPEELNSIPLKAHTESIKEVGALRYHHFEHNRVNRAVYCSKCNSLTQFGSEVQDLIRVSEDSEQRDQIAGLFFAEIRKGAKNSERLIRSILLTRVGLTGLADEKREEGTVFSKIEQIKKGVILFLFYQENFLVILKINTNLKKILKKTLVTSQELQNAFKEIQKVDASAGAFSAITEMAQNSSPQVFSIKDVDYNTQSDSILIQFKEKNLYAKFTLTKRLISSKFEFLEIPKKQLRSMAPKNDQMMPTLYQGGITDWYSEYNESIQFRFDKKKFPNKSYSYVWPYKPCKLYDLTATSISPHKLRTLIVNNQEAVIIEEGDTIPIDLISFRYYREHNGEFYSRKVIETNKEFSKNLFYRDSVEQFINFRSYFQQGKSSLDQKGPHDQYRLYPERLRVPFEKRLLWKYS